MSGFFSSTVATGIPLTLSVTSTDCSACGENRKLPRDADAVGGVPRVQLRVQRVRRLEERRVQGPAVALEPVPERRQGAVRVHPPAQIGQHLLVGLRPEQRFELRPPPSAGVPRMKPSTVSGKIARSRSNASPGTDTYPFASRCASITVSNADSE